MRLLGRTPQLAPDEPVRIERHFELDPSTFLRPMEAAAEREREREGPAPATGPPDFSREAAVNTLTALGPGDHVWYWSGRSSKANVIPRDDWFPGHGADPLDFLGNGGKIYNFVVYPDHVKCGQPQMTNKSLHPGSFAWLNNNPGNLSGPTADVGQYPGKLNGSPPKTPGFLVFPTPEAGRDALPGWLAANGGATRYIDMSIADAWQPEHADQRPVGQAQGDRQAGRGHARRLDVLARGPAPSARDPPSAVRTPRGVDGTVRRP